MDKLPSPELIESIRNAHCVLVLGPDLVEMAGLPSMDEIMRKAATEIGIDPTPLNYLQIGSYYAKSHDQATDLLRRLVKRRLEVQSKFKDNHILIRDLASSVVLVLSRDLLFEQSFNAPPPKKYLQVIAEKDLDQLSENVIRLFKPLGSIDNPSSLILTETELEDYSNHHLTIMQELKKLALSDVFLFMGFHPGNLELGWLLTSLGLELGKSGHPCYALCTDTSSSQLTAEFKRLDLTLIEFSIGEESNVSHLASFLRIISDMVKGLSPIYPIDKQIPTPDGVVTLADKEKQKIIEDLLTTRLGTSLSMRVDPRAVDSVHHYTLLIREDLLDYEQGDFFSVRTLKGVNISDGLSGYIIYSESSEVKVTFEDCNIKAVNLIDGEPLFVEPLDEPSLKFTQAFKIFFPVPIGPGEEFGVKYSIRLPGELRYLGTRGDAMSVSLVRFLKGVDALQFSVCLNRRPRSYWIEEIVSGHGREMVPIRPPLEELPSDFQMKWSSDKVYRIECKWTNPKSIAYFINYRFE